MLPLALYSLFALLTHCRMDPRLNQTPTWRMYIGPATEQLVRYQSDAFWIATQMEIVSFVYLIVTLWSTGLALPIGYAAFLRWNYWVSARTRSVWAAWDAIAERGTQDQRCPKIVRRAFHLLQHQIKRWGRLTVPNTAAARKAL